MRYQQINNCCFHYDEDFNKNFLCDLEKLIGYSGSAVITVSCNPCVGSLASTKISFFLLSICTDELLSTSKITRFLPQSKFGTEKVNENQTLYHVVNESIYLNQHF